MSGKRQTPMVKQLHKTLEEMVRVRSVLTGMQTGNPGNKVTDAIEQYVTLGWPMEVKPQVWGCIEGHGIVNRIEKKS